VRPVIDVGDRIVVTIDGSNRRGTVAKKTLCRPGQDPPPFPWPDLQWPGAAQPGGETWFVYFVTVDRDPKPHYFRDWEIRPMDAVERIAELA